MQIPIEKTECESVNHLCSVKLLLLFGNREDEVKWEIEEQGVLRSFVKTILFLTDVRKPKFFCSMSGCSGEKKHKNI